MFPVANIGTPEIVVIVVIIALLFGASRIPEIGKGLAGGIQAFRKAFRSQDKEEAEQNKDVTKNSDEK